METFCHLIIEFEIGGEAMAREEKIILASGGIPTYEELWAFAISWLVDKEEARYVPAGEGGEPPRLVGIEVLGVYRSE